MHYTDVLSVERTGDGRFPDQGALLVVHRLAPLTGPPLPQTERGQVVPQGSRLA